MLFLNRYVLLLILPLINHKNSKLNNWKFILVVGIAASVTVPTQVILISVYGEVIVDFLKQVKLVVLSIGLVALALFILNKWRKRQRTT